MARPRSTVPTYRKHSATGRAAVSFYRADGTRTEVVLPGKFGSKESKAEYERLLSQLRANGGRMPIGHRQDLSIDELVLKFLDRAKSYYVDPITKEPTGEVATCRDAFRALCRLYGNTGAAEFGPLAFQALRTAMTTGSWLTKNANEKQSTYRPGTFDHEQTLWENQDALQMGSIERTASSVHLPRNPDRCRFASRSICSA